MKVSNNLPGSPSALKSSDTGLSSKVGSKAVSPEGLLDTKSTGGSSKAGMMDSSRVDVSSRAQEMRKAKELATPSDSIDEAKVARLQKMIDEGNYKIDAEAIADRLVDEHMKMP
jgi:negative regulator of flagellin synthesis FlgM